MKIQRRTFLKAMVAAVISPSLKNIPLSLPQHVCVTPVSALSALDAYIKMELPKLITESLPEISPRWKRGGEEASGNA